MSVIKDEYYPGTRVLHYKYNMYNGKLHNEFKPALIEYYPFQFDSQTEKQSEKSEKQTIKKLAWLQYGKYYIDSEDLPSVINFHKDGSLKSKLWVLINSLHRTDDKPAEISYYKNTTKVKEMRWYTYGKLNRNKGLPAIISFDKSGNVTEEGWFINDEMINYKQYN